MAEEDKTPRWGYSKAAPEGKLFNGTIPKGWVDTPAKLNDKQNSKTDSKKKSS